MPVPKMPECRILMLVLMASGLSILLASGGAAQVKEQIVIDGTPVVLEKTSIKCEIKDIPANVSVRRLADCYSAKLVVVEHDDVKFRAVKFTIRPETKRISSGVRAELRDMHEAHNGEETWYRFSTLLPKNFAIESKHRLVLAQWHERMNEGKGSLRPPLSHRLWDGRFVVTLWNKDRIKSRGGKGDGEILFSLPELDRGVFYEFVYKIVWSPKKDGEIAGWIRQCKPLDPDCTGSHWQKIIRYSGSTGYDNDDIKSYYFKLGLYTVTDFKVPFTAYHRGYRIGASAAEIGATDEVFR